MKKHLFAAALLPLLLLLAACAKPAPPQEPAPTQPEQAQPEQSPPETPQFSVPTFQLSMLPQLAQYEAPREIVSRYYSEEFIDELQAAPDYGRLYPYEGKIFGEQWWESRVYYGLTDEQGRVVVDPVYRYTYFTEPKQNGGEYYLVLSYPVDKDDQKAQDLLRESDGWIQRSSYTVASADGSWVSDFFYGDGISVSENRIIVSNYGEDIENMWRSKGQTYRIYDMQGQLIASGEGQLGDFNDGLARLCYSTNDEEERYCYLDTDGKVAIPGPFLDAYIFQNGRAAVSVGENWEKRLFAVINTRGEYVAEPSPENISLYGDQENYNIFEEPGNTNNRGIKDKAGNIVAPADYSWISLPYEDDATLAVGSKVNFNTGDSYWLIDLQSGGTRQIEIENATVNYARIFSGNWCVADYNSGTALLKGEKLYRFDSPDGGSVDCRQISGQLFAVSYMQYDEQDNSTCYVDIFDADKGQVVNTVAGVQFSHVVGELMVMSLPQNYEYMRLLNFDATPAFNGALSGEIVRSIGLVADDVYNVRTALYSGLLRKNGEWLLRVYVNTLD